MRSVIRETLLTALLDVPALVDLYRDGDPGFVPHLARWLERLEQDLGRLRHPLAGFAASQRAQLLAITDGLQVGAVTTTGRKAHRAAASSVLGTVEPQLREEIATIDAAFEEPRERMAQLVAVAAAQGQLPPVTGSREGWLERVWAALPDGNGAAGVREYLSARLPRTDRLFLLDQVVSNLEDTGEATASGQRGRPAAKAG